MKFFRKFFIIMGVFCLPNLMASRDLPSLSIFDDIIKELKDNLTAIDLGGYNNEQYSAGCSIDIQSGLVNPQPLFLVPGTTKFYYPKSNGKLEISSNKNIEFHCEKSFLEPFASQHKIVAKCIGKNQFQFNDKTYKITDFVCKNWFPSTTQRKKDKCHGGASTVEVGFQLKDKNFVPIYDVCHDDHLGSTLYVHHYLNPSSNAFQHGVKRIKFHQGDFYDNLDVDHLYKQVTQKETIGGILNGNHEKYFNEKKALFLARGHLTAKADHIYANQQRGTFHFINAAPQWQIFNAGNWQTIEDDVRIFVGKKKLNLECYTGTWGVGTLADGNGDHQELYLHFDGNVGGKIPVPKIYYRVIIDSATRRGIVLIGVNNPHLTMEEIHRDYIICNDISDKIKWIHWKKDNILLGYSYACEVNEFANVVEHLPKLNISGILF